MKVDLLAGLEIARIVEKVGAPGLHLDNGPLIDDLIGRANSDRDNATLVASRTSFLRNGTAAPARSPIGKPECQPDRRRRAYHPNRPRHAFLL